MTAVKLLAEVKINRYSQNERLQPRTQFWILSINLSARIALEALGKDKISAVNRFSEERLFPNGRLSPTPTSDTILIFPGVNRTPILAKSSTEG
jgi:hypothetical protein